MAKRTTAPKNPKGAAKAKDARSAKSARSAKNARSSKPKTSTPDRTRSREGEMSTSVLEGPMKSLIAEALMKRK